MLPNPDAQISDEDIAFAVAAWKLYSPVQYRSLIDGRGAFRWDADKSQYFDVGTGNYINATALRNNAIEPFITRVKAAMREIDKRLQSNSITVIDWQSKMTQLIKSLQIAPAIIAAGGVPNVSDLDRAGIAASILAMLAFLRDFVKDIESGKQKLNGSLLARTDLYANSARDAYEEARRNKIIAGAAIIGATLFERRVLDKAANHCVTDGGLLGCVELAAKGWQPIGTLPRLYNTPCGTNCKCHYEYK